MASNLTQRVAAAAIFGPFLLVVFWVGGLALLIVLCVLVGGGVVEFYRMQEHKGLRPWFWPGVVASLLWCVLVYFYEVERLGIPLAVLVAAVVALGSGRGGKWVANAESTLMGVLYVAVLGSFAYQVRRASFYGLSSSQNALLVVLILAGIWASDIAGYFAGRAFGKRHPFPEISPGKTGAGYVGGLLGALAVVYGGAWLTPFLALRDGAAVGVLVGLGAPLGDLVESMIKRDAGVKDTSAVIPGHGGILDRFDSFLFVYPLVYVYVTAIQAVR